MSEDDVEKAITAYLRFALPKDAVSFHIPNGGYKLTPYELGRLKRAGYVAGIPDRCILWGGSAFFIECKGQRGRLSPAQEEMFSRIRAAGFKIAVVKSVEEVEVALTRWDIPINARLSL